MSIRIPLFGVRNLFARRRSGGKATVSAATAHRIGSALRALAAGVPVVLVCTDRADAVEAELVCAGVSVSTTTMDFLVRHSSGFVTIALPSAECDRLGLPPMHYSTTGVEYAVSVDAIDGVGTGISAHDRAVTSRALANPAAQPEEFTRPGHTVPIRAAIGGVLERPRRAEAALDLTREAGQIPAAVMATLVSTVDERRMADFVEAVDFADRHHLTWLTVSEVHQWRTTGSGPTGHAAA
ncbi:3,4-dihydroxy-2-butanone-4-phosphate synthase [Rhodococcus oxybenzonivorans]|uniref:3,4-dihydroxy-2-butanone-4-phosphate synthase n=1 Tax=Rhodococcus oxybenzonivorans TaxID=1990687 RepID=UPI0029532CE4|nr:3,4-dihydroxy-2-butanone-4-phosphate synthase [Rhodococcus oxybenzonivorans]MDV7356003.1 3,4-dihydroxy-2-butanone-4-phosphate synthase [Rhodococcus oxybenzonivorans]